MHKATESAYDEDNSKGKDVPSMEENDPWNPSYPPCAPGPAKDLTDHIKLIKEPLNDAFVDKLPRLVAILEKDSVRLFLNLFKDDTLGLAWGFVITPQTFNQMIVQNALRCVKVALEGKAPELNGHRANPNYMNSCGYFPLHQAAKMFSADMIKLIFHYGASANLRTSGPEVIEGLLPLHVAVENACRHKFLEDNLLPDKENTDYVYMLIQLVCLPEMDGKLAETTVLLLVAQKKIRAGSSFKTTGNSKTDGFSIISNLCTKDLVAIDLEIAQNRAVKKQLLKAEKRLRRMALLLVIVISEAGEALDSYIRAHPSCPYDQQSSRLSGEELPNKYDGYATAEKGMTQKLNTW
ncbi:uncharacterized protein [Aegilops tauschii subsp. strangulata]|uniref:uncharacterized protein n=1 Tax=Aegilops tauschii subsp. strangulata TaxID=200361 RepID=UPI00098B2F9C|nr:uncharacterized protein LOC109757045 [Aegilops tauschii subsp. strangulata]